MLSKKEIAIFKELLTNWLKELEDAGTQTVSGLMSDNENEADPLDNAAKTVNRDFTLRLRDRESVLIRKIKKAINRIEDGTFGTCELCEEDISIERLKARPVTTKCIECKKKEEMMEKTYSN